MPNQQEKAEKLAHALIHKLGFFQTYSLHIRSRPMTADHFYIHPEKPGIVFVLYGKAVYEEGSHGNQFVVICINRQSNTLMWFNSTGQQVNCTALEVLFDLKYHFNDDYFMCTQHRFSCGKDDFRINIAFMFYLVDLFTLAKFSKQITSIDDIMNTYFQYIPKDFTEV